MSLEDTQAPATPDASIPSPVSTPEPAPAVEPVSEKASEVSVDDDLAKVWAKNNATRDENGRFASRETDVKQEAPPAAVVPPTDAKTETTPTPSVEPPRAWSAEQKALWAKIPPEAQPIIAARENELHEIKTAAGRLTAEYKPLRDTISQHAEYFGQIGQQPAQWLNNALQVSRMLDGGQAPQVIKQLADQYGVDLGQLYDPLAPPPNQELVELRREISALKAARQNETQTAAASKQAAAIEEFQRLADEFKSKHPDASEIEDEIVAEIKAIREIEPNLDHAALLAKAYERAAWANPKTRETRIKSQLESTLKAQEEARVSAAKEAAARAKAAASVNVSGSPSSPSEGTIDEDLRAIWRKRNAA